MMQNIRELAISSVGEIGFKIEVGRYHPPGTERSRREKKAVTGAAYLFARGTVSNLKYCMSHDNMMFDREK